MYRNVSPSRLSFMAGLGWTKQSDTPCSAPQLQENEATLEKGRQIDAAERQAIRDAQPKPPALKPGEPEPEAHRNIPENPGLEAWRKASQNFGQLASGLENSSLPPLSAMGKILNGALDPDPVKGAQKVGEALASLLRGGAGARADAVLVCAAAVGKNDQHGNPKAQQAADEKLQEAEKKLKELESKPNKTPEDKEAIKKAKAQVDHWRKKRREVSENHSKVAKGSGGRR